MDGGLGKERMDYDPVTSTDVFIANTGDSLTPRAEGGPLTLTAVLAV